MEVFFFAVVSDVRAGKKSPTVALASPSLTDLDRLLSSFLLASSFLSLPDTLASLNGVAPHVDWGTGFGGLKTSNAKGSSISLSSLIVSSPLLLLCEYAHSEE